MTAATGTTSFQKPNVIKIGQLLRELRLEGVALSRPIIAFPASR
ncbi:MAG: hypothetical protein M5R42_12625 [Rhodocyclaceae bacterium]|nr:hypothetical protein [Rhodocyclaceae bacterium]